MFIYYSSMFSAYPEREAVEGVALRQAQDNRNQSVCTSEAAIVSKDNLFYWI